MKHVYVFLADGFEEIEGLTVVDILRRAGADVMTVSVTGKKLVEGSHNIRVEADMLFDDVCAEKADMLVLPGGMPGTVNLKNHEGLRELLCRFDDEKKYIAAICAAPTILSELGILRGRKACSYPTFEDRLDCGEVKREPSVQDGHIITGRGMGAAIDFALRLTAVLCGADQAEKTAEAIVCERPSRI